MPELPEVETTLRGIQSHIEGQKISNVIFRHLGLRWTIKKNLSQSLLNQTIQKLSRRGKYLLLEATKGTIIIHLGMSGRLSILKANTPAKKHDHIDIEFNNKKILRFTDPRRFGAFLWTEEDPLLHPLLKNLGPEPLTRHFNGKYLFQCAQNRKIAVKSFIMDNKVVTGVGNIYATEALFSAKIHPATPANKISEKAYTRLVTAIKKILQIAIKQGGTTLKDFLKTDGKPGYFAMHLKVYGRSGQTCEICAATLKELRLGQRSSVFCPRCQCLV